MRFTPGGGVGARTHAPAAGVTPPAGLPAAEVVPQAEHDGGRRTPPAAVVAPPAAASDDRGARPIVGWRRSGGAARMGAVALGALAAGLVLGTVVLDGDEPSSSAPASAAASASASVRSSASAPSTVATTVPVPVPATAAPPAPPAPVEETGPSAGPLGAPPTLALSAEPAAEYAVAPPVRISIPDLGIAQTLIGLRVGLDGALQVPSEWMDIGWWSDGPAPGEPGGAVIAGHVNGGGEPAVFVDLATLGPGAQVVVDRADGSQAVYAVTAKEQFAKDDFPDAVVYSLDGPSRLHLVTCGGEFDRSTGHYFDNVVVFADLVSDTGAVAAA